MIHQSGGTNRNHPLVNHLTFQDMLVDHARDLGRSHIGVSDTRLSCKLDIYQWLHDTDPNTPNGPDDSFQIVFLKLFLDGMIGFSSSGSKSTGTHPNRDNRLTLVFRARFSLQDIPESG